MAISRLTLTVTIFLVAAALHPHITRAQITATSITFPAHASSNLRTVTPAIPLTGVIYYPSGTRPFAGHSLSAVVMLHGCGGMWSDGNISAVNSASHFVSPGAPNLQTNIEKWGIKLAQSGHVALAVDSYTQRRQLPLYSSADVVEWQSQCAADIPWNGTVDPYTERVYDLLAAYDYLISLPEINSAMIASLGWSQGAQSTMIEAAVTTPSGGARSATVFKRNVSFYPGCGAKLRFGPSSNTVANSYWRPYRDMHLHVGQDDGFYRNCSTRATNANNFLGATTVVTFPTYYDDATHSFDNTPQTSPPAPAPAIPAEAWPTSTCATVIGNECAMKSADIDALAFLQAVL